MSVRCYGMRVISRKDVILYVSSNCLSSALAKIRERRDCMIVRRAVEESYWIIIVARDVYRRSFEQIIRGHRASPLHHPRNTTVIRCRRSSYIRSSLLPTLSLFALRIRGSRHSSSIFQFLLAVTTLHKLHRVRDGL